MSEAGRCVTTARPLTHLLDWTERQAAMKATRICSIPDCQQAARTRGWCPMHYQRFRAHGDPNIVHRIKDDPVARFFQYVDKSANGCWLWLGPKRGPYGYIEITRRGRTTKYSTHRFAYESLVGPIPLGLTIDHLCRTKLCCNPSHLEPVTQAVNTSRAKALITHCPQGHGYTLENTRINVNGSRVCIICARESLRRSRQRAKEGTT